jgi:hypothetical protein
VKGGPGRGESRGSAHTARGRTKDAPEPLPPVQLAGDDTSRVTTRVTPQMPSLIRKDYGVSPQMPPDRANALPPSCGARKRAPHALHGLPLPQYCYLAHWSRLILHSGIRAFRGTSEHPAWSRTFASPSRRDAPVLAMAPRNQRTRSVPITFRGPLGVWGPRDRAPTRHRCCMLCLVTAIRLLCPT